MRDKYPPHCPTSITAEICQFAQELGGIAEPEFVDVCPLPFAERSKCYMNCHLAQQLFGGEMVLGFTIWSTNDLFLTAEHHCILRQTDGRLIDVTPDPAAAHRLLFVRTNQPATPESIDEIVTNGITGGYKALVDHPLLDRAVNTMKQASERFHRCQLETAAIGMSPSDSDVRQWNGAVVEMEALIDGYYAHRRLLERNRERKLRRRHHKLERVRRKKARARA